MFSPPRILLLLALSLLSLLFWAVLSLDEVVQLRRERGQGARALSKSPAPKRRKSRRHKRPRASLLATWRAERKHARKRRAHQRIVQQRRSPARTPWARFAMWRAQQRRARAHRARRRTTTTLPPLESWKAANPKGAAPLPSDVHAIDKLALAKSAVSSNDHPASRA